MKPGVRVTFAITANAAYPVLDYSDFKETQTKEEDTEMPDQSVRTFLELVTDAQRRQGNNCLLTFNLISSLRNCSSDTVHCFPQRDGNSDAQTAGIHADVGLHASDFGLSDFLAVAGVFGELFLLAGTLLSTTHFRSVRQLSEDSRPTMSGS